MEAVSREQTQGSLPRYKRFLAEWHPHLPIDNHILWPNGATTSVPQKVFTVRRDAEGNFTDSHNVKTAAIVLPQRGYTYKFIPSEVSFRQQQIVNGLLVHCLEEFEKDHEQPIDFKALTAVLPIEVVDPAARVWLGSSKWEEKSTSY